jgi:hypothetical protein
MAVSESIRVRTGRSAPPEWVLVAPLAAAAARSDLYLMLAPRPATLRRTFREKLFGRDSGGLNGTARGMHARVACCSADRVGAGPRCAARFANSSATAVRAAGPHTSGARAVGALLFGVGTHVVERAAAVRAGRCDRAGIAAALQRGRTPLVVPLAVLCPLRQPAAGFFLAPRDRLLAEQRRPRAAESGPRRRDASILPRSRWRRRSRTRSRPSSRRR